MLATACAVSSSARSRTFSASIIVIPQNMPNSACILLGVYFASRVEFWLSGENRTSFARVVHPAGGFSRFCGQIASPGQADITSVPAPVRWPVTRSPSFNHLIRAQQERLRERYPERFGSPEVDDHLEFGGLLDGHIGGVIAPQELGHENRTLSKDLSTIGAVGDQPADFSKRTGLGGGWQSILEREVGDVFGGQAPLHDDGASSLALHGRECRVNLAEVAHLHGWSNFDAGRSAGELYLLNDILR